MRFNKKLDRVALRVGNIQRPTASMIHRLHARDIEFFEGLMGFNETG